MARITGTARYDELSGTKANDTFYAYGGSDFIYGGKTFDAPSGNDTFYGGAGDDSLYGGNGNDMFTVEAGADNFVGGKGFDTVSYAAAKIGFSISLNASAGTGSAMGDRLYGIERVIGSRFSDTIISGYDPHTQLYGGGGKDVLIGNHLSEKFYGGAGNDALTGFDTLYPNEGGGQDSLYGDGGDDTITAGINADKIYGGTGKDVLFGGAGNDLISGGSGHDTMYANSGVDRVFGDGGGDTFAFSTSETGEHRVMDFDPTEGDKLYLGFGGRITSVAQLAPMMSEAGGKVTIAMDGNPNNKVVIEHTTIAELTDTNVTFGFF